MTEQEEPKDIFGYTRKPQPVVTDEQALSRAGIIRAVEIYKMRLGEEPLTVLIPPMTVAHGAFIGTCVTHATIPPSGLSEAFVIGPAANGKSVEVVSVKFLLSLDNAEEEEITAPDGPVALYSAISGRLWPHPSSSRDIQELIEKHIPADKMFASQEEAWMAVKTLIITKRES